MILVKNDSELGEFIFFQQTICCAFACHLPTYSPKTLDVWVEGEFDQSRRHLANSSHMATAGLQDFPKTDRMSSIIRSWQWKLVKSDLIPQRWQKWCSLPGSRGYAGPHFRLFWVIFWGVKSDARGNSVASEKLPWIGSEQGKPSGKLQFQDSWRFKSHGTLSCLAWHDQILRLNRWGTIFPQRDIQIHDNF